ncbi:MAG TPA: hypothetical protein VG838_18280 [Opitutaceae bacterium]|nr:hypothetical protein [Opitutaceae bacterium]
MKTSACRLLFLVLAWAAAAALAGAFRLFSHLPPVGVQLSILGLTVGFSVALVCAGWLRAAMADLGVRPVLAFHVTRFVGIYFLWLHAQGRLPAEFAERAGIGDIAAAAGALVLLFWPEGPGFRRALLVWNIAGAADLLLAVGTAGWLNVTRPGSMAELAALPLTLVPLWIVPILLGTHVHLLRAGRASSKGQGSRVKLGEPAPV